MKKTNHFLFLSVAAVFAASFLLLGCGSDVTGTYTGTQTISQSMGGSKQQNVTIQMTESGGKVNASIISNDGSSGQLNGDNDGDNISNASMTYTQANNFNSGVNNAIYCSSATVTGPMIRNGKTLTGTLTGSCANSGFNNPNAGPQGNGLNNNSSMLTITINAEKTSE